MLASKASSKKKKRSLFDDDDFFVMKRAKKPKSPVSDGQHTPPLNLLLSMLSPQKSVVAGFASEDSPHKYHSASEVFADPNYIDLEQLKPESPSSTPARKSPVRRNPVRTPAEPREEATEIVLIETDDDEVPIVEDEDDTDLADFFRRISQQNQNLAELDRLYNVKVSSRLGRAYEGQKQITGETTFAQLLELLSRETLRRFRVKDYWAHGVLVWVEGRSELKPFFKPSTLRIPRQDEVTAITCLYVPKEHLLNLESLYPEFQRTEEKADAADTTVYEILDAEILTATKPDEKSGFFIIGLKGKDNKRIEVEVSPATKIRSLLDFYLKEKGLSETANCRLVFDEEELDLNTVVGDTELEDEFEVQVYT